jgi:hypothetical protein
MDSALDCAMNSGGTDFVSTHPLAAPTLVDFNSGSIALDAAHEAQAINGIIASMLDNLGWTIWAGQFGLDNLDEYRRAIFGLEELLDTLQCWLYNRVQALEQLQNHVRELGAQPRTTRSVLGAAFAAMLTAPRLLSPNQREDLMLDVDRGERAARALLNQSLKYVRLSFRTRDCISKTSEQLCFERCRPVDLPSAHSITPTRNPLISNN